MPKEHQDEGRNAHQHNDNGCDSDRLDTNNNREFSDTET
jgi:hypothetical protein